MQERQRYPVQHVGHAETVFAATGADTRCALTAIAGGPISGKSFQRLTCPFGRRLGQSLQTCPGMRLWLNIQRGGPRWSDL